MASSTERLSVFPAVASKVVVRLVSRYEKALPREKQRILVIFLYFLGFSLTSYGCWKRKKKKKKKKKKKNKMHIFGTGLFDRTKGEASFEGSFAIHQ